MSWKEARCQPAFLKDQARAIRLPPVDACRTQVRHGTGWGREPGILTGWGRRARDPDLGALPPGIQAAFCPGLPRCIEIELVHTAP
ncbi:hCG1816694 [Homo sapiens]